MATVRETIKSLQDRIRELEQENEILKHLQTPPPPQPIEEDHQLIEEMEQNISELESKLNHANHQVKLLMTERDEIRVQYRDDVKNLRIKHKSEIDDLRTKLHNIRVVKPKIIVVDLAKEKMEEYSEVISMVQNLQKENQALYELVDRLEKTEASKDKIDSLQIQIQELEELLSDSDEVYQKSSDEYQKKIDALEEENNSLQIQIQNLNGKIISKDIMINSYKDRYGKAILKEGIEIDLYPGEQTDLVRDLIEKNIDNLDKNSRRYSVYKSLLDANPENGERRKKVKNISRLFKSFTGFDRITQSSLQEFIDNGFNFVVTNTHVKMYLQGDDRFWTTLAKTSNCVRSMNYATTAIKSLL